MEPDTLQALEESIKKWEEIAKGTGEDKGTDNCALCDLFWHEDCHGCPVMEKSGEIWCRNTPYQPWHNQMQRKQSPGAGNGYKAETEQHRRLAQMEVDFLKSLLPEGY